MSHWVVTHRDIEHTALGETSPIDLTFSLALNEVGSIGYNLQYTDNLASRTMVDPYITDFELKRHDVTIMAGLHTAVNGSHAGELIQVSGLSWEHYLDRRMYPFNPDNVAEFRYSRFQTDVTVIIEEILDTVLGFSDSLDITYANASLGILQNYRIDLGDTETILSKIKSIASQTPGFDFEITPDRELILYAEKGETPDFAIEEGINLLELDYNNEGPEGNHILGLGAGTSSRLGVLKDNAESQHKHRRIDSSKDFGNIADKNALDRLTTAERDKAAADRIRLTAQVHVMPQDEVLGTVWPGDKIRVKGSVARTYDQVDDTFRILSMSATITNEGDEIIDFTFGEEEVA